MTPPPPSPPPLQVTCVVNSFQWAPPPPLPGRPQRPESVLGMPMMALPCVESPLEKLSGPQVRGGGSGRQQDRGGDTHPCPLSPPKCPLTRTVSHARRHPPAPTPLYAPRLSPRYRPLLSPVPHTLHPGPHTLPVTLGVCSEPMILTDRCA